MNHTQHRSRPRTREQNSSYQPDKAGHQLTPSKTKSTRRRRMASGPAGILLVFVTSGIVLLFHSFLSSGVATIVENNVERAQGVKIAWLMSFPNSGTSYTLHVTRLASQQHTATNYGKESDTWASMGTPMPVYENERRGPFVLESLNPKLSLSSSILTKTHCSGYRKIFQPVHQIMETVDSFLVGCRTGINRFVDEHGKLENRQVMYDTENVHKAIHLFRNPLANVVSRFHHEVKKNNHDYPDSREGFATHCKTLNLQFGTKEYLAQYIDPVALEALARVPCRSEFFRYAQWHNLAFEATEHLAIPTHILYYEDYSSRFNETVLEILGFLGQEWRGATPEFVTGKEEYPHFYTQTEVNAVKIALQVMSSPKTWQHIRHYFA